MSGSWDWTFGEVAAERHGQGWRVTRSSPSGWPPVAMWRTDDPEEARDVVAAVLAHRAAVLSIREGSGRESGILATHVEGVTSRTRALETGADVVLFRHGKEVMRYDCGPCDWRTAYIAGRSCASGGTLGLPDDLRGIGLGRLAYDEAERMVGLPLVPHGANLNVGLLSPDARKFWAKRIAETGTPGFDRAAAERREGATARAARFLDRPWEVDDPTFAVAVARELDVDVEWMVSVHDPRVVGAWCTLPGGKVGLPVGEVSREAALRAVLRGAPSRSYARYSGTPDELAAAVARNAERRLANAGEWRDVFVDAAAETSARSDEKAAWFLHDRDPCRWRAPRLARQVDLAVTLAAEAERAEAGHAVGPA